MVTKTETMVFMKN